MMTLYVVNASEDTIYLLLSQLLCSTYNHFSFIIMSLVLSSVFFFFFFSSRRRHTRLQGDWSSDVCSSDLSVPSCWRDLNNFWAYQFLKEAEKLIPTSFNILEKKVRFFFV